MLVVDGHEIHRRNSKNIAKLTHYNSQITTAAFLSNPAT